MSTVPNIEGIKTAAATVEYFKVLQDKPLFYWEGIYDHLHVYGKLKFRF